MSKRPVTSEDFWYAIYFLLFIVFIALAFR